MVKDSYYHAPGVSNESLISTVKSCLERLAAEPDPCVIYDPKDQVWVYLHCNRETFDLNVEDGIVEQVNKILLEVLS